MTGFYVFGFFLAVSLGLTVFYFLDRKQAKKVLGLALLSGALALGFGAYFFFQPPPEPRGPEPGSLEAVVEQLHARLNEGPDNIEGWATLGAGYFSLGRFSDAVEAYIMASRLDPANPAYHAAIGESVTLAYGGTVTGDARAAFEAALSLDPENEIANFYMGDYEFQNGEIEAALDRWLALRERLPENANWTEVVERRIEEARGLIESGPSSP